MKNERKIHVPGLTKLTIGKPNAAFIIQKNLTSQLICGILLKIAVPVEGKGHRPRRRGFKPRLPVTLRCAVSVEGNRNCGSSGP